MNIAVVFAGLSSRAVSLGALYVLIELSTAYWQPQRAGERWKAIIALEKLEYFAPVFKWLMPLFALLALVQFFIAVSRPLVALGLN